MAIPASAFPLTEKMDPSDLVDFEIDLSSAEGSDDGLLAPGEEIASYTLTLLPESVALGLVIVNDDPYREPRLVNDNTGLRFWFEVLPEARDNPAFLSGARLPIELTIETNSLPYRRRQRTLVVEVVQQ